jgi:predicted RNase H-like HicB family nuclease
MTAYVAFIRKDPGSDYGVEFPDLPGCFSVGSTIEEVRAMAAEAVAGHVALLQKDGPIVPEPSSLDALFRHADRADALMVLIDLDPSLLRSERVNVMIPRHLLDRIDAVVGKRGRSRFFVEVAEQRLAGRC